MFKKDFLEILENNFMKVYEAKSENLAILQEFIAPQEQFCVLLAEKIRKSSKNLYFLSECENLQNAEQIKAVFFFDGTLLFCLPENVQNDYYKQEIKCFLVDKNVHCIIGKKEWAVFIESILQELGKSANPNYCTTYNLMTLKEEDLNFPPEKLSFEDEIRRCSIDDFELLYDLQKMYVSEERIAPKAEITENYLKADLLKILKHQLAFVLLSDMEPVAKINTNAIGFNYIQIGGVFTHPLYRQNYYAWHLFCVLLGRIFRGNKNPCLFVKEKNLAAHNLYERIGFKNSGKFAIDYFD